MSKLPFPQGVISFCKKKSHSQMAHKRVPFLLSYAAITKLHQQNCSYMLKGYWEVKYKDSLFIKFEPFPQHHTPHHQLSSIIGFFT